MCINHTSKKPYIITISCTKGGSAKSTNAANIGAFCADHGLRTLLIDTDTQPTLSSYYSLAETAPGGIHEFLSLRNVEPSSFQRLSLRTCISTKFCCTTTTFIFTDTVEITFIGSNFAFKHP
nr:ParA family protein [Aggregatibacter actinomycetemcomitans]